LSQHPARKFARYGLLKLLVALRERSDLRRPVDAREHALARLLDLP